MPSKQLNASECGGVVGWQLDVSCAVIHFTPVVTILSQKWGSREAEERRSRGAEEQGEQGERKTYSLICL
jgi:hypothetical protein